MTGQPSPDASDFAVDEQSPFPGLLAFREREWPFFFGRQQEANRLLRLVRRDVATLLFGGSGLGKTSLIHAGLFPKLRQGQLLPVSIRIDFSAPAPHPVAQVKAAIMSSVEEVGGEVEHGGLAWDEVTLWELFHQTVFWSPTNRLLQPVLVFDQFEELFTLAANSRAATDLMVELENLIENQIPASVQGRLEDSGQTIDFSYDRRDFRVVVSLREDFLPLFEQLCEDIPSLRRNRMRLTALSPEQALEAVSRPNPELVDEEVGKEIVQFVADTAEHPFRRVGAGGVGSRAEVEPALLSLVCRELNAKRIAQGRDRITSDLLSAAKVGILEDFYDRSLSDLPSEVRLFVEDRLLTRSGYRNMVAMDDALDIEGISREDLTKLVDRRLIRIEDRLGAQRVELTHDVLTRTIRKSRDRRRALEREQERLQQERERMLSRQRELEAQHEAQRERNRRLARLAAGLGGAFLAIAVVAVVIVVLGVLASESARKAERQREILENALSFMLFDLRDMVESTGRMDVVERAAQVVLDQTESEDPEDLADGVARNREVALIALGDVRRAQGDLKTARESYDAAMTISRRLTTRDPENELWQHDLSVVHVRLGDLYYQEGNLEAALAAWREEEKISRRLVEKNPSDPDRQRELSLSAIRVGNVLRIQGRVVEAAAAIDDAYEIMTGLLAEQPTNEVWLSDLAHVHEYRAHLANVGGDLDTAREECVAALEIRRSLAEGDPTNLLNQGLLAGVELALGDILVALGDLGAAEPLIEDAGRKLATVVERDPDNADWQVSRAAVIASDAVVARARGDHEAAMTAYRERLAMLEGLAAQAPSSGSLLYELAATHSWISRLLIVSDEPTRAMGAARLALTTAESLASRDATNAGAARLVAACRQLVGDVLVAAGEDEAAASRYRASLTDMERVRDQHPDSVLFAVDVVDNANRLSHALWLAGDEPAARDTWHQAVAGLQALEIRAEAATRRALEGPLGAATSCALFRKSPEEGRVIGMDQVDPVHASRMTRAGVLGFEARRALFGGSPEMAIELSRRALAVDPNQIWIQLTLAHGNLLIGREATARELYLRYAHHPVSDALFFREAVLEDFVDLRAAGVEAGGMNAIERLLRSQPPR